jgi:RNA polymerase sigma factor (sigma-70 family)
MDASAPTDDQLLSSWAQGDRRAGAQLVERHFIRVRRFFHNKVGADLEDLVQQTFLGCVEAHSRYERRSSFPTFLLGIARNQLFNYYKSRRREAVDVTVSSVRDLGTSPTGALAKRDDERLLANALQQISMEAQVILELAYWDDFDGAGIAAVLDVPLNTAYTRLRRARESLRARLQELAPDHVGAEQAWRTFNHTLQADLRED